MGSWNYRLMCDPAAAEPDLHWLTEVHYDDDGRPASYIDRGAVFTGDSPMEVQRAIATAAAAIATGPVLTPADFPAGRTRDGVMHWPPGTTPTQAWLQEGVRAAPSPLTGLDTLELRAEGVPGVDVYRLLPTFRNCTAVLRMKTVRITDAHGEYAVSINDFLDRYCEQLR